MSRDLSDRPADAEAALHRAYNDALAFPVSRVNALALSNAQATEWAEQEAGFGTVTIDETGLSGGMRLHLLRPIQHLAAEWRDLWNKFDVAIEPKRRDIDAVVALEAEIEAEKNKRDDDLNALERELGAGTKYVQIKQDFENAEVLFNRFRAEHRGADANMKAKHWFYALSFVLVLATECFINYNSFTAFWNGVEFAGLGTTLVLGVLLAWTSHAHGEILKQWSYRFGRDRSPKMRYSDWRLFGLSTSALAVVLGFTGWARYMLAAASLGVDSQTSALGSSGISENPVEEVAISLIANLGAWLLGIFISYYAHDHDPSYMAATAQFWHRREPYNRARDKLLLERQHIEARCAKAIENRTAEAETRSAIVVRELDMLKQVRRRDAAIQHELRNISHQNVNLYRDVLVQVVVAGKGRAQIVKSGTNTPFSPFEYKAMNIPMPYVVGAAA